MELQRWGLMIYREVLVEWLTFILERYSFIVRMAAALPKSTGNTCAQTAHLPSWKMFLGKLGVWNSGLTVKGPLGTTQPSKDNIHTGGKALSLFSCIGKTQMRCSCVGPMNTGFAHILERIPHWYAVLPELLGWGCWGHFISQGSSTRAPLTFPWFRFAIIVPFLCILKCVLKRHWLFWIWGRMILVVEASCTWPCRVWGTSVVCSHWAGAPPTPAVPSKKHVSRHRWLSPGAHASSWEPIYQP